MSKRYLSTYHKHIQISHKYHIVLMATWQYWSLSNPYPYKKTKSAGKTTNYQNGKALLYS